MLPLRAVNPLMYLGVWPHTVLVMDAVQGKIVDKIDLPTDIVRTLVLSPDEKTLYASTVKDNSIVSIDLATRKITDKFSAEHAGTQTIACLALPIDPTGKFLYSFATPDRLRKSTTTMINPPEFVEIDLAERKITHIVPYPKDEPPPAGYRRYDPGLSRWKAALPVSRQHPWCSTPATLNSLRKSSFRNLPTPPPTARLPARSNDPNEASGKVIGIFDSSDPYVHRRVFGIAEIDLANMTYDLTPGGPRGRRTWSR